MSIYLWKKARDSLMIFCITLACILFNVQVIISLFSSLLHIAHSNHVSPNQSAKAEFCPPLQDLLTVTKELSERLASYESQVKVLQHKLTDIRQIPLEEINEVFALRILFLLDASEPQLEIGFKDDFWLYP